MGYESGLYVRTSLCLGVQADVCEADVCGRVCRRVALPMRSLLRLSKSILIYPRHRVLPVGRLSFGPCIFWCILVTLCALLFSLFRPMIYLITPTYKRYTQKADLVGMGNTLRQVRNIHWIVVEDADGRTALVSNFLKTCGLPYTHVVQRTPKYMQRDICKVVNPRIGCTSVVHLFVPCLALPCLAASSLHAFSSISSFVFIFSIFIIIFVFLCVCIDFDFAFFLFLDVTLLDSQYCCCSHCYYARARVRMRNCKGPQWKLGKEAELWTRPRGVEQRNAGLAALRELPPKDGVFYFADDDNRQAKPFLKLYPPAFS